MGEAEEAAFAKKLRNLADRGFGLTKQLVRQKAAEFCEREGIKHPFNNGLAGESWYRGFMKRHQELSLRAPSKVSLHRQQAMNKENVDEYFEDISKHTDNIDPSHIWNMDESGFSFQHRPSKIICQKGLKSIGSRVSNTRQNITVMACVSASGQVMPPMFIVRGKTNKSLNGFNPLDAPPGSVWTWCVEQEKGYMEDSLGVEWFKEVFLRHCGPHRPQVLIFDQHHSHEVYELLELAVHENITLITLPPHTSHWLQPLDKGCFGPLTKCYHSACTEFMAQNRQADVTKATFARLFCGAWSKSMSVANVRSGFRVTGIYPFNPRVIPDHAFATVFDFDRTLPHCSTSATATL